MNTRSIGNKGEDLAVKYFKKHGYEIIERNFRCHFGEIDIIARDGSYTVFIEVKSRASAKFGMPREAVGGHKQQTIARCAAFWLSAKRVTGSYVRFDVAEVRGEEVTVLKDAFRP